MTKQIQYILPLRGVFAQDLSGHKPKIAIDEDSQWYYGRAAREISKSMDDDGNFTRGKASGRVTDIQFQIVKTSVGETGTLRPAYSGEIYVGYHTEERSLRQFISEGRPLELRVTLNVEPVVREKK